MVFLVSRMGIVAFHARPVALRQELVPAACARHLRFEIGVAVIAQRVRVRRSQSNLAVCRRGVARRTQLCGVRSVRIFEQELWGIGRMRIVTAGALGFSKRLIVVCRRKIFARSRVAFHA